MSDKHKSEFTKGLDIHKGVVARTQCMRNADDQTIAGWTAACEYVADGATKRDLVVAIAALSAEVWAYRDSKDRDAILAIHVIGKEVDAYRARQERRDD